MSKGLGTWRMKLPFSVTLNRSGKTVGRYWRFAGKFIWSILTRGRHDQVEDLGPTNIDHPSQAEYCVGPMELEKFIKILGIGDRIRVFCDDGVLVAEKVSQTQFKLIDCQVMSESVN
jgi:hypothetical protein